MNKNRTLTTLIALLLVAGPTSAQIVDLAVQVDGLTCMFCAFSLEKSLKKLDGVAKVDIDIETGTATLTPRADATIRAGAVPAAVDDAGFTPRGIRVRANGRLERQAGTASLVDAGGQVLFHLAENEIVAAIEGGDMTVYSVVGEIAPPAKDQPADSLPLLTLSAATAANGES